MLLKTIILAEQPQDLTNGQLQMATDEQLLAIAVHFNSSMATRGIMRNFEQELERRKKQIISRPFLADDGSLRERFYLVNKE